MELEWAKRRAGERAVLAAMKGSLYVHGHHPLKEIRDGVELIEGIKRRIKASSLAETPEAADLVLSVNFTSRPVATYQDGSTFNTVTIRLECVPKEGGQLLSVELPGSSTSPPAEVFRMLGEHPRRLFEDIPKDEILAYVERLLREGGFHRPG